MKITNKFIFVFFITLLLFFLIVPYSQANISYMGKAFPDFPAGFYEAKYKVIMYYPNIGKYLLFFWNTDGSYYSSHSTTGGLSGPSLFIPAGDYVRFEWTPSSGGGWYSVGVNNSVYTHIYDWNNLSSSTTKQMIYSNFNISIDNTNELFFHSTPLLDFTTMQKAIGGNFWQTLMKVVTILVPVGLIIFGMLLVVYLVRLVISRVT